MEFAVADPWPEWAVRLFAALSVACIVACFGKLWLARGAVAHSKAVQQESATAAAFRSFQRQYLLVHFVISLADWMQGTNMYTLYQSYGMDVGALYLTGFSSSALFSVVTGLYADKQVRDYGRILYCVIEIVVNSLEHVPNFYTLLVSRILGGMSTSLLCSVFESRMVSAHRRHNFPEHQLADTFGLASAGSGFAAILAGVIAQVAADLNGDIGPFQVAIALTVVALLLIVLLQEDFSNLVPGKDETVVETSVEKVPEESMDAMSCLRADKRVWLLGMSSALFEGVVYTVVFIWVPVMQTAVGLANHLPTGLVFSCFMLCLTLGGFAFPVALSVASAETCAYMLFAMSALALAVLAMCSGLVPVLGALLTFEFCIGMFYPCAATLRSQYIPEGSQESVMNILRIPLNILVVIGTWLANTRTPATVFFVCAAWLTLAAALQLVLVRCRKSDGCCAQRKAVKTD